MTDALTTAFMLMSVEEIEGFCDPPFDLARGYRPRLAVPTRSRSRASNAKGTGAAIQLQRHAGWRALSRRLNSPAVTALGTRMAGDTFPSHHALPSACAAIRCRMASRQTFPVTRYSHGASG